MELEYCITDNITNTRASRSSKEVRSQFVFRVGGFLGVVSVLRVTHIHQTKMMGMIVIYYLLFIIFFSYYLFFLSLLLFFLIFRTLFGCFLFFETTSEKAAHSVPFWIDWESNRVNQSNQNQ